jgi:hypothetical protein
MLRYATRAMISHLSDCRNWKKTNIGRDESLANKAVNLCVRHHRARGSAVLRSQALVVDGGMTRACPLSMDAHGRRILARA